MKQRLIFFSAALFISLLLANISSVFACTGISLWTADGCFLQARTIEWASSYLDSKMVVIPRGYQVTSMAPHNQKAMKFTAQYGVLGVSTVDERIVTEAINEAGLSAGFFYFKGYGSYEDFDPGKADKTVCDLQLVTWMLTQFSTVDEVIEGLKDIIVVYLEPDNAIHWRVADPSGKQVVIEIVDGKVNIYDNTVGVIGNAPGFPWQLANLNNYVNLYSGAAKDNKLGDQELKPFGAGSGMLGLPGDITPPSRFVRAAFWRNTAAVPKTAVEGATLCFHLMNLFDEPIGALYADKKDIPENLPSATQWTSVVDCKNQLFYYNTMYNNTIRVVDLKMIDFEKVQYQAFPIDKTQKQPLQSITIN